MKRKRTDYMTNALTTVAAANALSADISYVKSPMSVDDYGVTISRSWRKVVSGILDTGRLLLDAQERLTREEFTQLRQRLSDDGVMSTSVISKLMGVAFRPCEPFASACVLRDPLCPVAQG
jgi:hypothetical protein